jgi:hypothetical protein
LTTVIDFVPAAGVTLAFDGISVGGCNCTGWILSPDGAGLPVGPGVRTAGGASRDGEEVAASMSAKAETEGLPFCAVCRLEMTLAGAASPG